MFFTIYTGKAVSILMSLCLIVFGANCWYLFTRVLCRELWLFFLEFTLIVFAEKTMSDHYVDLPFSAEYAKSNRASCKSCGDNIAKDTLRLAIMVQVW